MPRGTSFYDTAKIQQRLWTPQTLYGGALKWWVDPSDPDNVTVAAGVVSQANDTSGQGRTLTQATAGNRPAYSQLAGTMTFDGVNDGLTSTSPWIRATAFASGAMVFSVCSAAAGIVSSAPVVGEASSVTNNILFAPFRNNVVAGTCGAIDRNAAGTLTSVSTTTMLATGFDGVLNVLSWRQPSGTGVTVSQWKNGTLGTTGTGGQASGSDPTHLALGSYNRGATPVVPGAYTIGEVIGVQGIDDDTRLRIEGYLGWKWGLNGLIDPSHPYKNRPPEIGA